MLMTYILNKMQVGDSGLNEPPGSNGLRDQIQIEIVWIDTIILLIA